MKAIKTKYLGATNTLPSRIKASAEGVPCKVWTCDELETAKYDKHQVAAWRFALENQWSVNLASGVLSCDVWVHCFILQS